MNLFYRSAKYLVLLVVGISVLPVVNNKKTEQEPEFRQDLRSFGFPTTNGGAIMTNFTNVIFLSNDLVLVTVNTRTYGPVEKSDSDQPPSKLLLFDLSQKGLAKSSEMPVEKFHDSVKATHSGNFVVLNESGVHLCSADLKCTLSVGSLGPLLVSPQGTRLVVGGNGQTEQTLLDADSFKQLDHFPWGQAAVVPGDGGPVLIQRSDKLFLRLPGHPEKLLPFDGGGIWPTARFLNDTAIADFQSETTLSVVGLDGNVLFTRPAAARWHSEISTTSSGSRFAFHESGYTKLNSIFNFYDIENGRHYNLENVQIISTDSGTLLFELSWDPRPYVGPLSSPALSPDGHKLGLIRGGFLEVYRIP
jgi:hypothetical protein